jgi:hypothetical protein
MISPQRRAEVIDALRRGTVPKAGLDVLAVGYGRLRTSWGHVLLGVRSNIHTLSFSTPLGSGNHVSLRTASMWRGKLGVFPFALP